MRAAIAVFVFAWSSDAAITNLSVNGTTSTQAVVSYTAPDETACTIQISQNAGLSPLALDVDPNTFANSNLDLSRPSTITMGRSRTLVIGQRTAQYATAGTYAGTRHFSRALQAYTLYYGLITCPSTGDTASFQFSTSNIPLGSTYGDPWLSDPAHPGDQPWPESVGGLTTESFIDPLTGVLLQRLGLRGNNYRLWNASNLPLPVFGDAYNQGHTSCDSGHAWTNPCGTIVTGGSGSTTIGNSQARLVLRPPLTMSGNALPWNSGYGSSNYGMPFTLDQLAVTLTGSVNSSTTANRVLDVCLSLNGGASCVSSPLTLTLGQTSGQQTVGHADGTQFGVLPWLLDTNPRFNVQESAPNFSPAGSTGATASGNTVTWTAGSNYWSLYWVNGGNGRIRLSTVSTADACTTPPASTNSAEYTITSFIDGLHITVSPTPPSGNLYWCENNFAVVVWRDQMPTDGSTVTLTGASLGILESFGPTYPDNGAGTACLNTLVQGGYFCLYGGLFWINPSTGATAYYGTMWAPNPGITNPWNTLGQIPNSETANIDETQSVLTFYSVSTDPAGGGPLVIQGIFNPSAITQPSVPFASGSQIGNATVSGTTAYSVSYNNGLTFTNLTPQNPGGTCETILCQMAAFDSTPPTFARFGTGPNGWNCSPYGTSIGVFFFNCFATGGDSPAWIIAFSPGDGNPAHAGTAGGPHIVGAVNTFNTPAGTVAPGQAAMTGRSLHALTETGETGWMNWSMHIWPAINTTNTPIPASSSTTCASFGVTGNNSQCIALSINSHTSGAPCVTGCTGYEPYFVPPYLQSPPFTGAPGELRTTQLGDTVCVTSNSSSCNWEYGPIHNELMTLVQKNPNGQWVFQRASYAGLEYAVTSTPVYLWWQSDQFSVVPGSAATGNMFETVYWNPIAGCNGAPDPHGNCLLQDTNETFGHAEWRDGGEAASINVPLWQQPFWGWPPDYQTMVGSVPAIIGMSQASQTPNTVPGINYVSMSPPFAGVYGHPWGFDLGTHPNPAGANAPPNESRRAFDNIPFQGSSQEPPFSVVSGQLYCATPSVVTDNDDFFGSGSIPAINRKLMAQGNSCGSHPLIDISGPNSSMQTGTSGSYTVCYTRNANECYPGSTVGQVYVNCPGVVWAGCTGSSIHGGTPMGVGNDICVGNQGAAQDAVRQFTLDQTDLAGAYTRNLVTATSRLRMVTGFENNRMLPDNSWLLFRAEFLDYQRQEMWAAKMLPWPEADSVARGSFVQFPVEVRPLPSLGITKATVEFGYQEYGAPAVLNCTTRNDPCLATSSTIPAGNSPFYFASENPAGLACASGCVIMVPAIPQRVLYYRILYWGSNNVVLAASQINATIVDQAQTPLPPTP